MSAKKMKDMARYPTGYGGTITRADLAFALRLTTGEVGQLMRTRETA